MNMTFYGDSYDIVKWALLRWLRPAGAWSVHPMFTAVVAPEQVDGFSQLLDTPVLTADVLTLQTHRSAYFASARECRTHLFLDPDTGLLLRATRSEKASKYLFLEELVSIARSRPNLLTLVFDQSIARGQEGPQLDAKLAALGQHGVAAVAYRSHVCYLLVGVDRTLVELAQQTLLRESRLPKARLVAQLAA